MTEKEILEKQVEALEKLLQIKEAIIQEQDSKIARLENEAIMAPYAKPYFPSVQQQVYPAPGLSTPSVWTPQDPCVDGAGHNFNYPWFSTNPQPCAKCGALAASSGWTVSSSNVVELDNDSCLAAVDDLLPIATISNIANK